MPPRLNTLALFALAVFASAAAPAANAAQLSFSCLVQSNRPDHGLTRWRRRIVLTSADHMARYFDDTGAGLRPKSAHPFVSVNRDRVVLDANGAKQSSIDRRTGEYVLRNAAAHFELRGRCRQDAGGEPAQAGLLSTRRRAAQTAT